MKRTDLARVLAANAIPDFRYFDCIDSTNDEAIKWIDSNPTEYSLVLADDQSAGRGRMNRKWVTTPGASLAISIILFPRENEKEKLGLFSLLGGLAVRNSIDTLYGINAKVKWPNDVLIGDQKTAGILAESVWDGSYIKGLVLGIGINIYKEAIPPSKDLMYPATCIQDHTQLTVDTIDVIASLLNSISELRKIILQASFQDTYMDHMAYLNEKIMIKNTLGRDESGILQGIDGFGNLILADEAGTTISVAIGDVSLRKE